MKTILVIYLLFAVASMPIHAQASPPASTMSCVVEKPLNPPLGQPISYDVSNIDFIEMDILIDTKGKGDVEAAGAVMVNPPPNGLPSSYLVITATNASGISVPISAKITGGDRENGAVGYVVSLFLPEDATTRTTKEQARIDSAKATDGASDPNGLAWMNQNNAKALAALDRIYTQSQVGAFTISCTYVSTKVGLWNGTVQSSPIVVNVLNKGSQLDNLH